MGTDAPSEWWARIETPAQRGMRLADETLAPSYRIKKAVLQKTIRKAIGRKVRLPWERGAMKVKAKQDRPHAAAGDHRDGGEGGHRRLPPQEVGSLGDPPMVHRRGRASD